MGMWETDSKQKSEMEDIPGFEKPCNHPEHNPPMHLYIPPGKQYRHICPGCKKEKVLRPDQISF